jgi:hypothetical protein
LKSSGVPFVWARTKGADAATERIAVRMASAGMAGVLVLRILAHDASHEPEKVRGLPAFVVDRRPSLESK